ncbi:hypothetical protein cand_034660 [Cryptosporidium andersoni]|uniref:Uncharacterized protein n=1 Tax=Cryptosporidium andersoni TaxID=117008 RepID=A0A1J4MVE3_9CRYT|nr:hypothetical protein cand_034660 [Cryptosporidium andersoni]
MDNPKFLQYFWDLGNCDEESCILAIEGVISSINLSESTENKDYDKIDRNRNLVILPSFIKGSRDLEYTINRLIRGLESPRECVRRGYSACLSVLLSKYTKVPTSTILSGIEKHYLESIKKELKSKGKTNSNTVGDLRDRIIGLLLGYIVIIRTGFFKTRLSQPYIESIYENLWLIYDIKIYLQDMICEILYRITVDFSEVDPILCIKFISQKIQKLFDNINPNNEPMIYASRLSILMLYFRLRLFAEKKTDFIKITLPEDMNDLDDLEKITISTNSRWKDWKQLLFSNHPLDKLQSSIILKYLEFCTFFHPRLPLVIDYLLEYVIQSPYTPSLIAKLAIHNIIDSIEKFYFDTNSLYRKHFTGARIILHIALKCRYFFNLGNSNLNIEDIEGIFSRLLSSESKCTTWFMRSCIYDNKSLFFAIFYVDTLINIVIGKDHNTKEFVKSKNNENIGNFSFNSEYIDIFGNPNKFNDKPSLQSLDYSTISQVFWDNYNSLDDSTVKKAVEITQMIEKEIKLPDEIRSKMFWSCINTIFGRSSQNLKILLKNLIRIIPNSEPLEKTIECGFKFVKIAEEADINKHIQDNDEDDTNLINTKWRKHQWVDNVLFEIVQYRENILQIQGDISGLIHLLSDSIEIIRSIISYGDNNSDWSELYYQASFPRSEKTISRLTQQILEKLLNINDNITSDILSELSLYNQKVYELIKDFNPNNKNSDENIPFMKKYKKYQMKKIENCTQIGLTLFTNSLSILYITSGSNIIESFIMELFEISEKEFLNKTLNLLFTLEDNFKESSVLIAGIQNMAQCLIKFPIIISDNDAEQIVLISQRVSQLPDFWNVDAGTFGEYEDEEDIEVNNDNCELNSNTNYSDIEVGEDLSTDIEMDQNDTILFGQESTLAHLLDDDVPLPPIRQKQLQIKDIEKQNIADINVIMQNKLRALDMISSITNTIIICKPTPNSILAILRSLILLLEGYRVGCRHSLYYSMKNILSVFCDYTNKLKSIFTKILQLNIFKDPIYIDDIGDVAKLLMHILSKPVVESQTLNRWNKKKGDKSMKNKLGHFTKQLENISISLITILIKFDIDGTQMGHIFNNTIKSWISQKKCGIITSPYILKLIQRIPPKFLVKNTLSNFNEITQCSKTSFQLREYLFIMNRILLLCNKELITEDISTKEIIQTVKILILHVISDTERDHFTNIKFNTSLQKIEFLRITILLANSLSVIPNNNIQVCELQDVLKSAHEYTIQILQSTNQSKVKKQLNKVKTLLPDQKRIKL